MWQRTKTESDKEAYRIVKGEARRCVAETKSRAWIELSENLNTAEGRNKMFRVAAQIRKDQVDDEGTNYIRDENVDILIAENSVREIWRKYFEELLNVEN